MIPVDSVTAYLNAHFRPERAANLLAAAQPLMAIAREEGWAKAYAAGFGDAKDGKNYNAIDTNPYRPTK